MKEPDFLFLIGAARSGTKFLRDTLGVSEGFAAIPFDINFVWRRGNEAFPHDELGEEHCPEEIARRLRREVAAKGRRVDRDAGTVIEKSVSNALRVPFVRRAFPEARYVFLVRDGKSVVESSARVWNETPPAGYRLRKLRFVGLSEWPYLLWYLANLRGRGERGNPVWGPRYAGIEEDLASLPLPLVCAKQWVACNEAMLRDAAAIPAGQVHHVRYEELVRDEATLAGLCAFAGVADSGPVLERYRSTVQTDANAKSRDAFAPETVDALAELMNPTLEKLGYAPYDR